jgi:hypothetical protein
MTTYIVLAFLGIFLAREEVGRYRYSNPMFPLQGRGAFAC